MKYCPYCGADLVGSAVSFCSECGKPIAKKEQKSSKKIKKDKKPKKSAVTKPESNNTDAENLIDENYDGYYDDIRPADENAEPQGIDKAVIKNLVIIIAGVIAAISACVAAMYLM